MLTEFNPFSEISQVGSSVHFTIHSAKLLECGLKVNGLDVIPTEIKSLTARDRMSVKRMPRVRFHELYQDHLCSCVLRISKPRPVSGNAGGLFSFP